MAFEATDIERSWIWFWQAWEEFFINGLGNDRGFSITCFLFKSTLFDLGFLLSNFTGSYPCELILLALEFCKLID